MRALIAFFWATAMLAQNQSTPRPGRTPADVAAGAKTFRSHCAECHGLQAEGGRGPNLAEGRFYHGASDADLLKNISEGILGTEMPGLFYSEDRVWQVIAFIRSLNEASHGTAAGDRGHGERIFLSSGCSSCHRVQGNGGRMGPDLTNIGKIRSAQHLRESVINPAADVRQRYWIVDLVTEEGKPITGFLMNEDTYSVRFIDFNGELGSHPKSDLKSYRVQKTSRMPSYKDRFSVKDLDDLVAYLSSLRPGEGGRQ